MRRSPRASQFIESLINKKEGHIAGNDAKAALINYVTSINVMALTAADKATSTRRWSATR